MKVEEKKNSYCTVPSWPVSHPVGAAIRGARKPFWPSSDRCFVTTPCSFLNKYIDFFFFLFFFKVMGSKGETRLCHFPSHVLFLSNLFLLGSDLLAMDDPASILHSHSRTWGTP